MDQSQVSCSSGISARNHQQFVAQMVYEWFMEADIQAYPESISGRTADELDACHIRSTKRFIMPPEFGSSRRMTFMSRLWPLLPQRWQLVLYVELKKGDKGKASRRKAREVGIPERLYIESLNEAFEHISYVWDNRNKIML